MLTYEQRQTICTAIEAGRENQNLYLLSYLLDSVSQTEPQLFVQYSERLAAWLKHHSLGLAREISTTLPPDQAQPFLNVLGAPNA